MILSQVHNWQGDSAVKQILVFVDKKRMVQFDAAFQAKVAVECIEDVADSNMGAILKLRAVSTGDGNWVPIVRCGFDGTKLFEGVTYNSYESALIGAYNYMVGVIFQCENMDPVISDLCNSN